MIKIIKLQPHYRKNANRSFNVVPKLTMSGDWLSNAGFLPNQKVNVLVENGRIIVSTTQTVQP